MKKLVSIVIVLIILIATTFPTMAVSLWDDRAAFLYSQTTARRVGDIVTIIIEEKSAAAQQAKTETNGESDLSITQGAGVLKFLNLSSGKTKAKYKGDGKTLRTGQLSAKVTAVITAVLPNGNLVLRGSRRIRINREIQEMIVTGIARPVDISPDNTIKSEYLAEAEFKFKGRGAVGETQSPGLLNRIFHFLF